MAFNHDVIWEISHAIESRTSDQGDGLSFTFDPDTFEPERGYGELTVTMPDGTEQTFSVKVAELLPVPGKATH